MDYYHVLQIARSADVSQIKAAYKRLAKMYHPDHNPGNSAAEERFKQINEAYHVLTDPIKKSRYDERFQSHQIPVDARRETQRYRYSKMRYAMQTRYRVDKEYFRIQALTFLVFIVIAGFCMTLFHTATYLWSASNDREVAASTSAIQKAKAMFLQGNFEGAITFIDTLQKKNPGEYRFVEARDSLLTEIRMLASNAFAQHEYAEAVVHYRLLEKRESPVSLETLQRIAFCQYYLGNYREALVAMKHLHHQDPSNLILIYNIGIIDLDYLEDPEDALLYFSLGERKFQENLTELYGSSFESNVHGEDLPDIYYDLFVGKARVDFRLKNYDDAGRACDWAIRLRPNRGEAFAWRALCNAKSDKNHLVCDDLAESKRWQYPEADSLIRRYCKR